MKTKKIKIEIDDVSQFHDNFLTKNLDYMTENHKI